MKMRRRRKTPSLMDRLDQASECGANLAALSELLIGCERADLLSAQAVARVGALLAEETRKLRRLLEALYPGR